MNFCDTCETCAHCLLKGCIPIQPAEPEPLTWPVIDETLIPEKTKED